MLKSEEMIILVFSFMLISRLKILILLLIHFQGK